jgi:flavin reductase (DIM6/NTAB) family NADH-FMN oxidoreductase RutF
MTLPSDVNTRLYRRTMGLFATGVTVLAITTADGEPIGMTANSLTSVSLEPTLLLVCVQKTAHIMPRLLAADFFSLSILSEEQAALSDYFAGLSESPGSPPFEFVAWEGGARLADCVGAVGCLRHEVLEGGDHWIVLGRVCALYRTENPRNPLIFFGGSYRRLLPAEA